MYLFFILILLIVMPQILFTQTPKVHFSTNYFCAFFMPAEDETWSEESDGSGTDTDIELVDRGKKLPICILSIFILHNTHLP